MNSIEQLERRQYLSTNLVADLSGIYPQETVTLSSGVSFFTASDGKHGRELWKSDGTAAGTGLVCDINRGDASTPISHLIAFRNGVAFFVDNQHGGLDLWISNGTSTGTKRVTTVEAHTLPSSLVATSSRLIWLAGDTSDYNIQSDGRVWSSDGTAARTAMVAQLHDMVQQIPFHPPAVVGDRAIFGTYHNVWVTDGTTNGTVSLASGTDQQPIEPIGQLTAGGGFLFWQPGELCVTDGTLLGTQVLAAISKNVGASTPIIVDGIYYFAQFYDSNAHTTDLWRSDGTVSGTRLAFHVDGLVYGAAAASGKLITATRTDVFDQNGDGTTSWYLYAFDFATAQVTQLERFSDRQGAIDLTSVAGSVFFKTTAQDDKWWLWRTDGTESGTQRLTWYATNPPIEVVGERLAVTTASGVLLLDPAAPELALEPTTASASLSGGVLRVFGTSGDDSLRIFIYANDHSRLIVQINGVKHSFALNQVTRVKVYGYSGNDEIAFLERNGGINIRTNVDGGAGNDAIYTSSGRDTIVGSFGNDTIWGGNNDDMIDGGLGDDSILGGNGNDTANGGDGSDFICGGKGADQLGGGDDQSADTLYGNDGGDVLFGTQVIDIFFAGTGKVDPSDLILD